MYEQIKSPKENKSKTVANSATQKKGDPKQGLGFVDNRSESIGQREMQILTNNSSSQSIQKKDKKSDVPVSLKPSIEQIDNVVQRTVWEWNGQAWKPLRTEGFPTPRPVVNGKYPTERISTGIEDPFAEGPVAIAPTVLPITYGAAHGDLHFIANPTRNKSAWTIPKAAALTMMSAEITNRMPDIVTAARASHNGQVALLLIADAGGAIGKSVRDDGIVRFQIQLQADINGGISYHGFPDDQAHHTGLGGTRNTLV